MSLCFECTMCGACCRRPGVVVIGGDELGAIAKFRNQSEIALAETNGFERNDDDWWLRMVDSPCPFLDGNHCSIHEVRPRQCRTYPFWPEIVGDIAAWEAEAQFCEGIGRGRAWPSVEVQSMLDLLGE